MASRQTSLSQINPATSQNSDLHASKLDEQTAPYLLNAGFESRDGGGSYLVSNEPSTILGTVYPEGMQVIGRKYIPEQDRLIVALASMPSGWLSEPDCDPTKVFPRQYSEIGEILHPYWDDRGWNRSDNNWCKDCPSLVSVPENLPDGPISPYRKIIGNNCLGLSLHHPVQFEYKITDCDLRLYWVDGYNPDRYAYFDYQDGIDSNGLMLQKRFHTQTGLGDCDVPHYSDVLNCEAIRQTPVADRLCIQVVDVVSGGQLAEGVYQVFGAYSDENGAELTEYQSHTNPVSIATRTITDGNPYATNQAIQLDIQADSGVYQYYTVAVMQTIHGVSSIKKIGTFPVGQIQYTYTGGGTYADLSLNTLLNRKVYYEHSEGITQANNYLLKRSLAEKRRPNFQRIANLIKLGWQTTQIPEDSFRQGKRAEKFRGYMRDEVYPAAVIFEWDDGEDSCAIHLPGRPATAFDRQLITNDDAIDKTGCRPERKQRWQVYNTGSVQSSPHQPYQDCQDTVWETGQMAYWESTERYPNNPEVWGELCGEPIRHPKFPDNCITHIHDGMSPTGSIVKAFVDKNMIYPIGIQVDHESVNQALLTGLANCWIHPEDYARIKGYRIVRGNRVGNQSIIAKGLLYDVWAYDKYGQQFRYPNYPYNDLRPDRFISSNKNTYDAADSPTDGFRNTFEPSGRYTFHSPDVHFTSPNAATSVKLETVEFGEVKGNFEEAQGQARYRFLTTLSSVIALSAGVATYLSAQEEKKCTTYTVRSDSKMTGKGAYGDVHTGNLGLISGTGNIKTDGKNTDIEETVKFNNTQIDVKDYKGDTTQTDVAEYTKTFCENTQRQIQEGKSTSTTTNILMNLINGLGVGLFSMDSSRLLFALQEVKIVRDLIEALLPWKSLALQYNSVGRYSNYQCVANDTGSKVRALDTTAFLTPLVQSLVEDSGVTPFNNWERESSYYLKLIEGPLLPPSPVVDTTRFTAGEAGLDRNSVYDEVTSRASSYYASLKNEMANQYGRLESVRYLETGMCSRKLDDPQSTAGIFGGDIFINRFALKRKHPFFTQTRYGFPDGSEVRYEKLGNAGYPNYYFDTYTNIADSLEGTSVSLANFNQFVQSALGVPKNRLDLYNRPAQALFYQAGFIYLYSYGIPYFFAESTINTDLRTAANATTQNFYPNAGNLNEWLQEKNVPITWDNYYGYNFDHSKQATENTICIPSRNEQPNLTCQTTHPNRAIYSDPGNTLENSRGFDNWLVFRANNYHDFSLTGGKLTGIDGIESDKVLVRQENITDIFSAYVTIQTDSDSIQVGNGGMFQSRPQEYARTDLGYFGSQHREILRTEFGHVTVDAKRGQVFILGNNGSGLDEISKNGWFHWFKENLPFHLLKDFPGIDVDNSYIGRGLTMGFDPRLHRFFLTKRDYRVRDRSVQYDPVYKEFYRLTATGKQVVELTDPTYFCDASWTASFNFYTKTWVHWTFHPNYYVSGIDGFRSGLNGGRQGNSSLWYHGLTNKSYQVFYGKIHPFMLETQSQYDGTSRFLTHIEYRHDVLRYHNQRDVAYINGVTYNKAIVHNPNQCSGMLVLNPINGYQQQQVIGYPKYESDRHQIQVTQVNNLEWRFNQFKDITDTHYTGMPIWLWECSNHRKALNNALLVYPVRDMDNHNRFIRKDHVRVLLINDTETRYHFLHQWTLNGEVLSWQ